MLLTLVAGRVPGRLASVVPGRLKSLPRPSRGSEQHRKHLERATRQPRAPRLRRMASAATPAEPGADAGGLIQYVVLRSDLWKELSWPLGSVVAQGCHAATAALWLSRDAPATQAYCAPGHLDHMHKVVLEVKGEPQLRALSARLGEAGVAHKLWVEQPEGYATCLATAPAPKAAVAPHVKKLKLCKGT